MKKNKQTKERNQSSKKQVSRSQLDRLKKRAESPYCEVRESPIHGRGVYAKKAIPKEEKIIEYVGEKISKEESERRAWAQIEQSKQTGEAGVYLFTLSDKWDIDGDVPWNTARLINHSCDPNCEAWIVGQRIEIYSLRAIKKGEELSFNYGFDIENYQDHPCSCGADTCVGYIVSQEQWSDLEERLQQRQNED